MRLYRPTSLVANASSEAAGSAEANPDIGVFLLMVVVQPANPDLVKRPSAQWTGRTPLPAVLLRSLGVRLGELTRSRTALRCLTPIPQPSTTG
jgi:hypothetical protein